MRTIVVSTFIFLIAISSASAQPWTAVGSSANVDESAAGIYAVNNGSLGYLSTSTSTASIVARFNVTSTGSATPAWNTLEILANNANVTNGAYAFLYSVSRTTGTTTLIGSLSTTANPSVAVTTASLPPGIFFDFNNNYYFVHAVIVRVSSAAQPSLLGVRLY